MKEAHVTDVISISGLVKRFGSTLALDHLDLEVRQGEVHGFLGPNGAGKSTAIRILLGLLRKDEGEVTLLGGDPWHDAVALHRRLAYVPDDVRLWPNLTGGEVIDLFGSLRGTLMEDRREELLERFKLDPTKKCGTYSRGNRQKVSLVSAFASDVELLIMDEPTAGLDPLISHVFRDCVHRARDEGRTVLMSSHILADVEALCDRITIIREGQTVESGTLEELRHLKRIAITVEAERRLTGLEELPGIHDLRVEDRRAEFQVDAEALDGVLRHVTQFGVKTFTSTPPTLEQLFMRHYGDGAQEAEAEQEAAEERVS
jgi:ABC-2 type transport system ATP-binding protein